MHEALSDQAFANQMTGNFSAVSSVARKDTHPGVFPFKALKIWYKKVVRQ